MKKVLLICGSNRCGNTQHILEEISKKIDDSSLILLRDKNIKFCMGCLACHNVSFCAIDDDMNEILKSMEDSRLIIFGVPNYFDNVSGLFKNFMDRMHPFYKSGAIANKKTIFIYVGGGEETGTKTELHKAVAGLVKYLELNVVKEFSFRALNSNDMIGEVDKIDELTAEVIEEINDESNELI